MKIPATFSRPLFASGVALAVLITAPVAATIGIYWKKSDVVPVIMVRPGISGFVPVDGTPIGNTWSKDEVTPMCPVRPSVGGFVPTNGSAIGNTWSKELVKPFVEVEPSLAGFTPKESSDTPAAISRMDAAADVPVAHAYVGLGSGHWVKKVSNAGRLVELEDGSTWDITVLDRIYTSLWLPITNISVVRAMTPIGDYKYTLINKDAGETVLAKFVGM